MDDESGWSSYDDYADTGSSWADDFPDVNYASLAGQFLPVATGVGGGTGAANATFQQTNAVGAVVGAAGAAVVSLGARLAGMFGRGAGRFVLNGVKGSMASLWPYVRKYGPASVAAALGISLAQLGQLLMAAPQGGRKRRRGISARDITTTSRVLRFNARLNRKFGMRGGGGGRRYRSSSRGHYHYFRGR